MKTVLMVAICYAAPLHGEKMQWPEVWRIMNWTDADSCQRMQFIFDHHGSIATIHVACKEAIP